MTLTESPHHEKPVGDAVTRRLIEIESLTPISTPTSARRADSTDGSCSLSISGGGPGAMEAANLGAYLSSWPGSLDEALTIMKPSPSYRPSIDAWAHCAFRIRAQWPIAGAGRSLSIPTWFYGHEPTNLFATEIAKYFSNALRENTLLNRCRGGVVYRPGRAGTVQEIFQAATENFYAADASLIAPLILVGRQHWTDTYPAWPLLQRSVTGDRWAS